MKKIILSLFTVFSLCSCISANAQSFLLVPTQVKDMATGENTAEKQSKFTISANSQKIECPDKFWDVLFKINLDSAKEGDTTKVILSVNGESFVIAGFTFTEGKVVYTDWFPRSQVYYEGDPYNHWYAGQVVDATRRIMISFAMYGDNPWNNCSGMEITSTGGLKIQLVSLVTVANSMCVCNIVAPLPLCATICMKDTYWWSTNSLNHYRVAQFGMNFGNEVSANQPIVIQNLRNGNSNGQAAAFQLQFQRQNAPPQDAGRPSCYGIRFDPVQLSNGSVTNETPLTEINRLLKEAIKNYNSSDFIKIVGIVTILNSVRNCPQ
ncbi:MAG TPA: hypothetical protein PLP33_29185 [Leptospiraceae bacterium]|nr:hypothetical protein [Leptospiraceae bacterium]